MGEAMCATRRGGDFAGCAGDWQRASFSSRRYAIRVRLAKFAGSFSTRARNGSKVMLRNVTPWRASGSASSKIPFCPASRRFRAEDALQMLASSAFASRVTSTAGNCHIRENSTSSCAPGSFTSSVRPCGIAQNRRGDFDLTAARFLRGAGISLVRPCACARHQRRYGASRAARRLRRANRFAQFHQRLIPIAGVRRARVTVALRRESFATSRRAQIAAHGAEARQHARNVAIEHSERLIVRDA